MSIKLVTLMFATAPLLVGCINPLYSSEERAETSEYLRKAHDPATYQAMDCETLLANQSAYHSGPGNIASERIRQVIDQVVAQRDCSVSAATNPSVAASSPPATQVGPAKAPAAKAVTSAPVSFGYLGAHISPVTPAVVKSFGLPSSMGVLVFGPEPGIDAEKLGLLPGDIILEVAGTPVNNPPELTAIISRMSPGFIVPLKVWRYKAAIDVRLEVSDSPTAAQPQ